MKNNEFIEILSEKLNFTKKDTKKCVDTMFYLLKEILIKGNTIKINNFGNFKVVEKNERIIYNPFLNKKILIPPKKVISFKSCKKLI